MNNQSNFSKGEQAYIEEKLKNSYRKIRVDFEKKPLVYEFRVIVDGKIAGTTRPKDGYSIVFQTDGMPRYIHADIVWPIAKKDPQHSSRLVIPVGTGDLIYTCKENDFKLFSSKTRKRNELFDLIIDSESFENCKKQHIKEVKQWRFEYNLIEKLYVLKEELENGIADVNVAKHFLNSLTDEEKQTDIVKQLLTSYKEENYAYALKNSKDFQKIYQAIDTVDALEIFDDEIQVLNRHREYFLDEYIRRLSLFAYCENFEEELKRLKKDYSETFGEMEIPESTIGRYTDNWNAHIEFIKSDQMYEALKKVLWTDFDQAYLDSLKCLLIFDSLIYEKDSAAMHTSETLRFLFDSLFGYIHKDKELIKRLTVDQLISLAITYQRGNIMDNINVELEKTLETLEPLTDNTYNFSVNPVQFNVLQQLFEYLKAPAQEKIVLEAMFKYNIPRTPQQEQRLKFLNKGGNSSFNVPVSASTSEEGIFRFDYRTNTWNIKEIEDYIDNFSMNSQIISIPMVVDSHEHNLQVSTITWDETQVEDFLRKCLMENFGEQFVVNLVDTNAVLESGTDMLPGILITEKIDVKQKYPYLGFLVLGEQLTLKQLSLSIYVIILPKNIKTSDSSLQIKNAEILNHIVMLKEKQNPRINNYVTTVNNVLTSELQSWLNGQAPSDIYS